jgi:uncharacterized OsmC-like protein
MPQQQRQPQQDIVNGIDVQRLTNTIDAIKTNPDLAKFRFRAHNWWVDGTHARTSIRNFYGAGKEDTSRGKAFVLDADEPAVLLGEDHGPNATEALLYALASCLNTTFIYHAAARGVKVDELEIDLEGELDLRGILGLSEQVRRGYKHIAVTFRVKSDAPRDQFAELCELAQKRSPVFDMVSNPTPVSVHLETK